MFGRSNPLTHSILLSALLSALGAAGEAQAHRLNAQAFLLPNRKVQIESWFSSGDAAKGAKVEVFRPDGQLLTQGLLDDQGVFVFSYEAPQAFKVVISAGPEHRKELAISPADLAPALEPAADAVAPIKEISRGPVPLAERSSGVSVKDVILGITFLLALAAFWLSLRNTRKLRHNPS
jgi:nickel transport protein